MNDLESGQSKVLDVDPGELRDIDKHWIFAQYSYSLQSIANRKPLGNIKRLVIF